MIDAGGWGGGGGVGGWGGGGWGGGGGGGGGGGWGGGGVKVGIAITKTVWAANVYSLYMEIMGHL